jgi:hypothetical protein
MALTFERTFDYDHVRRIVTNPRVYRTTLLADGHPKREDWMPPKDERIWYVAAQDEAGWLGAILFVPHPWGEDCREVHLAFLPRAWGHSAEISLACIEWLKQVSGWRMLICSIPDFNRLAVRLAYRTGFALVAKGVLMQNGRPASQLLFGRQLC